MGQHKKVLRTEAVQVFTQQEIDGLERELAALNARIREIETSGQPDDPALESLKAQAIVIARRIDELRCSLRAHQ